MTVATARLIRPDARYETSVREAIAELHAEQRDPGINQPRTGESFAAFVTRLVRMADPLHVEDDFVPQSTFWLVDGDAYIGRLSLRHHLNEGLRLIGGHIGYDIRPSMRRRGYGTRILALGLHEARTLGLVRVLVTCDKENLASRRIIERNGGVFEDETTILDYDGVILQYWITL
jgi:predicted acetyltransferase